MTNSSVSPLNEIHAAIKSKNPFKNAGIVQEQNIWGEGFPDLTSLNKKASDTVFKALEQVKNSKTSHEKVVTLVWTASQGVGKTHNLKRIRKHLEQEGGGLFVYGNANKYTDLNLIQYQFQQTLANSLAYPGSQGVSQWQEVAAAMANEALKAIDPNAAITSPPQLVNLFDQVYTNWLNEGKNLMTKLSQKVLQSKRQADPYFVRAILWTLSQDYSPLAIKWLAGDALDQTTADYLGLPSNFNKTNQERESYAFDSILKILNLVSHYNSVIICFDELESFKVNDAGFTTSQVMAQLVHNLYNSLMQSELGQGIIILTVVLPDIWKSTIMMMPNSIVERMSKYTNKKPINLDPLNSNSILDLVALWLQEELYKPLHLTPPHPVYPFDENQLRDFGKEKPSVREVLAWCAEHFDVDDPLPDNPAERFKLALEQTSQSIPENYLEDNNFIAEVLALAFKTLKGECLEGETSSGEKLNSVVIQDIAEVEPKATNQGWINFKLIGQEQDKPFKIGVAVIQQLHGISVGAGIKRLSDYKTYDLSRGCLVRSQDRKIKKQWDSYNVINQMIEQQGGEWVDLSGENLKPLINIYSVFQEKTNYRLSEEEVLEFSQELTKNNSLLLEILSKPSGHIKPDNGDDIELLKALTEHNKPNLQPDKLNPENGGKVITTDITNGDDKALVNAFTEHNKLNPENSGKVITTDITNGDDQALVNAFTEQNKPNPPSEETNPKKEKNIAFLFNGSKYEVSSWKELLITVCNLMKSYHATEFDKVLNLKGRERYYFSNDPSHLKRSEQIQGTDIYVEINLSSEKIKKNVKNIIALFGYPEDSISFEIKGEN
ncbi:ATP-binding protein [Planktothrix sp. FACHB-1365]|uniref:ATP-binding protein n=1 Tax=Planktothrix sp. FACHB-1365 TaxID=2692855 RepID=UPI001683D8D6|nr:ATP-binding protein [Planktothrix sp. FACHB-1365]MBD2484796.1 ATP-binding protein [Planktothrix sp. FACHB-1365]